MDNMQINKYIIMDDDEQVQNSGCQPINIQGGGLLRFVFTKIYIYQFFFC